MHEKLYASPTGNPIDGFHCDVRDGICQLPMGERFKLDTESSYTGGSLVGPLLEKAENQPNGLTRLQDLCDRIIGDFPSFSRADARYWSQQLINGSTWLHKVLPLWAFMLLSAGIDCPKETRIVTGPPVFVQLNPEKKMANMPPELIGKIFPLFGWFDDYGWSVQPEFTITRLGSSGQRIFPGGHLHHPLDWPWRELTEEVCCLQIGRNRLSLESTKHIQRLRLAAVIDQTNRIENQYHRYLTYGFEAVISDGPGGDFDWALEKSFSDYSLLYYPAHADGTNQNDWEITPINFLGEITDSEKSVQLNEVEKIIIAAI